MVEQLNSLLLQTLVLISFFVNVTKLIWRRNQGLALKERGAGGWHNIFEVSVSIQPTEMTATFNTLVPQD